MAAPEIQTIQSVLGYLQWQEFEFQPYAINTPTYWVTTPLPTGVSFDTATGTISGPATVPGVTVFALRAGNVDGLSEPVQFVLGIEAAGNVAPANLVELDFDLVTKQVSVGGETSPAPTTSTKDLKPLFWVKAGDDLILNVRLLKNGIPVDVDATQFRLSIKQYEPETVLKESTDWAQDGEGSNKFFRVYMQVESDLLRAALSDYEGDTETWFPALAEIEVVHDNTSIPVVGPSQLRTSSLNFVIGIPRDINVNE